jgi:putative ABC transport system permease protein
MIRVALKGLLGRKLRSALSAMAIVLGVAMISGTYVLTDTINGSFNSLYKDIYKGTDAFVAARSPIKQDQNTLPPSIPESLLAKVRAVKDVRVADGGVQSFPVSIIGKNGKIIANGGAPNLGFSVNPRISQFNTLTLVSGSWPGSNQVVIDEGAAKKGGYKAGDLIGILGTGPEQKMRLSGIVRFGTSNGILGATLAGFDLQTAQRIFGKVGKLDYIQAAAKPGVSPARLTTELQAALPASVTVKTGQAQAAKQTSDTSAGISIIRDFLLAFAAIALFVGIFVIVNSLSITIAQRTREFATLRTLGASRSQVLGSIVGESLIVGAVASAIGLLLGFGLARFLMWVFGKAGLDLPANAMVILPRTIWVSLIVGIVVTLIASVRPALRATRVPPIAAVREGATLPTSRFHRFRTAGSLILIALGFLSLLDGLFAKGLTTKQILSAVGVGALLIFIGVALVSARFVKPLSRFVSPIGSAAIVALSVLVWPISVVIWEIKSLAGNATEFPSVAPDKIMNRLALRNAIRGRERTASTAAALMIGLALVTLVSVFATSLTTSFKGAVDSIFTGDYAISAANSFSPIPISAEKAAAKTPGIEAIASVRLGSALVYKKTSQITAVGGNASQLFTLKWKDGSQQTLDSLGSNGAIVSDSFAKSHHLKVRSPLSVVTPTGQSLSLEVAGIFKPPTGGSPLGDVSISAKRFDSAFQNPLNEFTMIKMRSGQTPANAKALDKALTKFPNAKAETKQQFVDAFISAINQALTILYVLLAFSVVISFFGIVNTLVLTVFERTREIGMLRAIGTTQRQARRMVRHEAVITALIGGTLGIVLGMVFGALLVERIKGLSFAVPDRLPYINFVLSGYPLTAFAIAAVIVGIIAAIFPARRAARLNVLEALQYE